MEGVNASKQGKTVASPNAAYESAFDLWAVSRAVCAGQRYVKAFDSHVNSHDFSGMLLLPFSPSMTQQQFDLYKSEAEFPGIVSQYAKIIVGGLLRKKPTLELPDNVPEEARSWLLDEIGQDGCTLSSLLDTALWDELQTSRAWIYVDYPVIPEADQLTTSDFKGFKPYPVLWDAESIINWRMMTMPDGSKKLQRVFVKGFEEVFDETDSDQFYPDFVETVWLHELVDGCYQIRKFQLCDKLGSLVFVNGGEYKNGNQAEWGFRVVDTIQDFKINGKPLDFIPAWPLNGSIDIVQPMMNAMIDKEIALYNKISRRNHLLYGAATYTPWISSEMDESAFAAIVDAGLGSWIHLQKEDKIGVLPTPTEALTDMDRAISAHIEEMAKMGIRMLTPETGESGVALEIRNAAQTAQLGTLNMKVSATMSAVLAFMLNWRYDLKLTASDVKFTLSSDFNPAPLGADWLRLVTEWYENGLIPRSVWLSILKMNDIMPPEYDDEKAAKEINEDGLINPPTPPSGSFIGLNSADQLNSAQAKAKAAQDAADKAALQASGR